VVEHNLGVLARAQVIAEWGTQGRKGLWIRKLTGEYLALDVMQAAAWADGAIYATEAAATIAEIERVAAASHATSTPEHFEFDAATVYEGPDDSWFYDAKHAMYRVLDQAEPSGWAGDGCRYADIRDQFVAVLDEAVAVERWIEQNASG
jgi:hypothetical protein